jgi:hypothetical protein
MTISIDPWSLPSTLLELGELTAQWLEGTVRGENPWDGDDPDPETGEIASTLAALNRIGFVTTHSQPAGGPQPDWSWAQRAAVSGFASEELSQRIEAALCQSDLITIRFAAVEEASTSVPITLWPDGRRDLCEQLGEPPPISPASTWEGGSSGQWELDRLSETLNASMIRVLTDSEHVVALDPH